MNFETAPQEFETPSTQSGQGLKDIKELKVGNGAFYVDNSGNIETRDENGVLRRKLIRVSGVTLSIKSIKEG